jgi:hypothetical protein
MRKMKETPDGWIERLPEDDGPQHDDACMVCDRIDCICPEEDANCVEQSGLEQ